jgi:eukaryotic-like serine/threonine-protein kinase
MPAEAMPAAAVRPSAVPAPRMPPTLIGPPAGVEPRFELIRQLGAGGFGGVWLAFDRQRGHRVALKAAHAPDADTEQRIGREARALGAVRHPNCVSIFDLVDSRSDPGLSRLHGLVIVMAHLEGRTLDDLVRGRGTMDDMTAAMTWSRLADALDAAHRQGVLHRDVKPGNVLVDPAGQPHLIDFGIARARGDATLTLHGFVLVTTPGRPRAGRR